MLWAILLNFDSQRIFFENIQLCQYSGLFMAYQKTIQLDTPFSNGKFFSLSKHLPGRVNVDDFVFFEYPSFINPLDYMVAVDTLDTSDPSAPIRTIGPLRGGVELPHVHYDAYAAIYVFPRENPTLPTFYSRLNRGSTYTIPDVRIYHQIGAKYEMRRSGILTAGADRSSGAY